MTIESKSLPSTSTVETQKKIENKSKPDLFIHDSLHPMRKVSERQIEAKEIRLYTTDEALENLVEKIKSDENLKKMVISSLDQDNISIQIKKLLEEKSNKKSQIENDWILVEKDQEKIETSSQFAPYMIVTYPVKFLFSGVWMTTKFTYTCAKTLYNSFAQLQSIISVGLFVLMGINTIRGNNFYVLRKLIQTVLNLVSKNTKTIGSLKKLD